MLLHEFIEIPEWASLVLLPFSFGRFCFLKMNKLKTRKKLNKLKLKSLHKKHLISQKLSAVKPDIILITKKFFGRKA
jgi:hypothetical protein